MDEGEAVGELMLAPIDEFTSARDALVRRLKSEGDADLATRIARLRKPSLVLWALNHAAAVAATEMDALHTAAMRLREVQARVVGGDGAAAAELPRAAEDQRRAVDAMTKSLSEFLSSAHRSATPDTLRRVSDALRAASIGSDDTWRAVREGRLLAEPDAATFPFLDVPAQLRQQRETEGREERLQRALADAEAKVRRAEETERAAIEQEDTARRSRAEAARAVEAARAELTALQRQAAASR